MESCIGGKFIVELRAEYSLSRINADHESGNTLGTVFQVLVLPHREWT